MKRFALGLLIALIQACSSCAEPPPVHRSPVVAFADVPECAGWRWSESTQRVDGALTVQWLGTNEDGAALLVFTGDDYPLELRGGTPSAGLAGASLLLLLVGGVHCLYGAAPHASSCVRGAAVRGACIRP
jgi:hypothetical protein